MQGPLPPPLPPSFPLQRKKIEEHQKSTTAFSHISNPWTSSFSFSVRTHLLHQHIRTCKRGGGVRGRGRERKGSDEKGIRVEKGPSKETFGLQKLRGCLDQVIVSRSYLLSLLLYFLGVGAGGLVSFIYSLFLPQVLGLAFSFIFTLFATSYRVVFPRSICLLCSEGPSHRRVA